MSTRAWWAIMWPLMALACGPASGTDAGPDGPPPAEASVPDASSPDGPAVPCLKPEQLGTAIGEDTLICAGTHVFTSTPLAHGQVTLEAELPALFSITRDGVTLRCQEGTILKLVQPEHAGLEEIDFAPAWSMPPRMTWAEKVACGNPADQWTGKPLNPCLLEQSRWQARPSVSDYSHVGVYARGVKDVRVEGCRFEGFKYGLYFVEASGLELVQNRFRDNYHITEAIYLAALAPDTTSWNGWVPFYPAKGWEITLGGDIFLGHVTDSLVQGNEGLHSANGLDCYFCEGVEVKENAFPRHSQANLHLVESSRNLIADNHAPFGVRTIEGSCDQSGCDSAGLLIEEDSDFNVVRGNDLSFGGDGFFLRSVNHRCPDYNEVAQNDGSFSPHNAFESVFCIGNTFTENKASYSHHGFWLGYSRSSVVAGNTVTHNFYGISAEHAVQMSFAGNTIAGNVKHGLQLWTDDDLAALGPQVAQGFLFAANQVQTGDKLFLDGVRDGLLFVEPAVEPQVITQEKFIANENLSLAFDGPGKPFAARLAFGALGPAESSLPLPTPLPEGVRAYHRPAPVGATVQVLFARPGTLATLVQATLYPGDGRAVTLAPGDPSLLLTPEAVGVKVYYSQPGRHPLFLVVETTDGFYTGQLEILAAPAEELFTKVSAEALAFSSANASQVSAAHVDGPLQDPVVGADYYRVAAEAVDVSLTVTLPESATPPSGIAYWMMTTHEQVHLTRFYADMDAYNACQGDAACLAGLEVFIALPLIELLDGSGKVLSKLKARDARHIYNGQFRWDYHELLFTDPPGYIVQPATGFDPALVRQVRFTVYKNYGRYTLSLDGVRLLP